MFNISKKLNISFKAISLALNSNATLSTCFLFPDINHINFGERLISKYKKRIYSTKTTARRNIN